MYLVSGPDLVDAQLMEGSKEPLSLACDLQDGDKHGDWLDYIVTFSHNNVSLAEGDKYKIINNSLEIKNPGMVIVQ